MIRTHIALDEELHERVKKAARTLGISFAEFCRRSLQRAVLDHAMDKPWMYYAGILEGDPGDSETVDSVLYRSES